MEPIDPRCDPPLTVVRIRKALAADTDAICLVHRKSVRELCAESYSPTQIDAWIGRRVPTDYEAFVHQALFLVAEVAAAIAGFTILDLESGELHALYVDPAYVGGGIGRRLLHAIEADAKVAGLAAIALNATLNSVSFYERHGYSSQGPAVNELPGGLELPCVRMVKQLD